MGIVPRHPDRRGLRNENTFDFDRGCLSGLNKIMQKQHDITSVSLKKTL